MVRAACSLSMILISDSWARIPLECINGKMAEFNEQYKHYAPCFGQLILSNGLLENLRLYGPYSIDYKQLNQGFQTEMTVRDFFEDDPDDHPLFKLIKILFPSNAGSLTTQGVVGQKPFQDMLQDKPELIGHLINNVFYRLPSKNTNRSVQSMYNIPAKQLLEEQRLSSSIYKEKKQRLSSSINSYNERKNNFKKEIQEKIDTITEKSMVYEKHSKSLGALLNFLNSYNKIDKIKKNIKNLGLDVSQTKVDDLKDETGILKIFKESIKDITSIPSLDQNLLKEIDNSHDIKSFKKKINNLRKSISKNKESYDHDIENLNKEFEILENDDILKVINDVMNNKSPLSPDIKYLLPQILWAFAIEHYNTKEDLNKILDVLRPDLYTKSDVSEEAVTIDQIDNFFNKNVDDFNGTPDKDEKIIMYPLLYDAACGLIPYTPNENLITNGPAQRFNRTTDELTGHTFPDCQETAIRHLVHTVFYNTDEKRFDCSRIKLKPNDNSSPLYYLHQFLKNYPDASFANNSLSSIRNEWSKVIQDLNHGSNETFNIRYMTREPVSYEYELDTGVFNTIKVFRCILSYFDDEGLIKNIEEFTREIPNDYSQDNFPKYKLKEEFEYYLNYLSPEDSKRQFKVDFKVNKQEQDYYGDVNITVKKDYMTQQVLMKQTPGHSYFKIKTDSSDQKFRNRQSFLEKVWTIYNKDRPPYMEGVLSLYRPFEVKRQMGCYKLFPEKITTHGQRINFMKNICDTDGQFREIYGDTIKGMVKFLAIDIPWDDITNNKPLLLNSLGIEHDFQDQDTEGTLVIQNLDIKSLNVRNSDQVTNLKLENLNQLENISGIDKLDKLKTLSLIFLDELKDLDLSGCTSLESLRLHRLNNLKNISGTQKLDKLKMLSLLGLEELEDLDLRVCTSLERLKLEYLRLKKISFKNLDNLKTLDLNCLYELEDINLSGCTSLESLTFCSLPNLKKISGTQKLDKLKAIILLGLDKLEDLDLRGCTSLEDPRFLNLTNLKTIYISSNVSQATRDDVEKYRKDKNITVNYTDKQNSEEVNQSVENHN